MGRSVAEILSTSECNINKVGVRDLQKHQANPGFMDSSRFSDELMSVIESPGASLIIEAIGGIEPAFTLAKRCIQMGKPYVTANKMLVATHFDVLGRHPLVRYEAAVAAAIPIVETIKRLSVYDEILEIEGILNGTTNFMLCEMARGSDFSTALKAAQDLGYAEADPASDVDGIDASYKIAILGSIASRKFIKPDSFAITGIAGLTPDDFSRANKENKTIKLVSSYKDGICMVAPKSISNDDVFSRVIGSQNAISVNFKHAGRLFWQGAGAGGKETASAILSDLAQYQSD